MKRLVMLICVLVLMFDLSNDGHLGKAKFVAPHSPVQSLQVFYKHDGPEGPECHTEILRAHLHLFYTQSRGQPTKPVVQPSRSLIFTAHLSSAGGLPG